MDDAAGTARKILKQEGDILMWQEDNVGARRDRARLVHYFVGTPTGRSKSFDRPHDAWEYFRQRRER